MNKEEQERGKAYLIQMADLCECRDMIDFLEKKSYAVRCIHGVWQVIDDENDNIWRWDTLRDAMRKAMLYHE